MAKLRDNLEDRILDYPSQDIALAGRLSNIWTEVSYGELLTVIRCLAGVVLNRDRTVESIGVLSNRRCEAYISVLCAYFLGIKFVPLNPKFPVERLRRIVTLAEIDLVLFDDSNTKLLEDLGVEGIDVGAIACEASEPMAVDSDMVTERLENKKVDESSFAYQMFTSGSTGDPKGVPISYGNLDAYVLGISKEIEFRERDRFSQLFDLSFDLSMHDIFVALYCGGTVVAAEDFDLLMPTKYIEKRQIDVWFSVPVLGQVVVEAAKVMPVKSKLREALFCGEALPMSIARSFAELLQERTGVWNLYGPTEATIAFTARDIAAVTMDLDVAPLGEAFGKNMVAILSDDGTVLTDLAEGTEGMLLLGGDQVFSGYQPDMGNDVFYEEGGVRFYSSGDRVRFEASELLYLGREDHQVKIRGFRVELGEVEKVFRDSYGLDLVAAFVSGNAGNLELSLAYQSDSEVEVDEKLSEALPDYMIPRQLIQCKKLPTNVNGKIDRNALVKQYG